MILKIKERAGITEKEVINYGPTSTGVYDAGGGEGRDNLKFDVLRKSQVDMYRRTLQSGPLTNYIIQQENRQMILKETKIFLTVNVAREDFPKIACDIDVSYYPTASQSGWSHFINDVREKLGLEFIDSIVDRKDGSKVFRTLLLRDGGRYFVRQRESSSILEIIESQKPPVTFIWPITKQIADLQESLAFDVAQFPEFQARVDDLIRRPLVRVEEREAQQAILTSHSTTEILQIIHKVMTSHEEEIPPEEVEKEKEKETQVVSESGDEGKVGGDTDGEKEKGDEKSDSHGEVAGGENNDDDDDDATETEDESKNAPKTRRTYDKAVDIVHLHRVAIESFLRLAKEGKQTQQVAMVHDGTIDFVLDACAKFRNEVDLLVVAFKLIVEIAPYLGPRKDDLLNTILDVIEAYAPPPPLHRTRDPPRLRPPPEPTEEEKYQAMLLEEERRLAAEAEGGETSESKKTKEQTTNEEENLPSWIRIVSVPTTNYVEDVVVETRPEVLAVEEAAPIVEEENVDLDAEFAKRFPPYDGLFKNPWGGNVGYIGKRRELTDIEKDELKRQEEIRNYKPKTEEELAAEEEAAKKARKLRAMPVTAAPPAVRCFGTGFGSKEIEMVLFHSALTLFKLMTQSYIFRDAAFNLKMHEELSDIIIVCQVYPKVLEYFVSCIGAMYSDGLVGDGEEDELESVDASMKLSLPASQSKNTKKIDEGHANDRDDDISDIQSIDPITGMVIEAVSTVTTPSIDYDNGFVEVTPRVDIGEEDTEEPDAAETRRRNAALKRYMKGDPPSNITGAMQPPEDVEVAADKEEGKENINVEGGEGGELGAAGDAIEAAKETNLDVDNPAFEARYKERPEDIVVLAMSMCVAHHDISPSFQELAGKLLGAWDDASRDYRLLRRKGESLAGL